MTELQNAKRLKAYELYLQAGLDGKRRSLRSIAQELGLHISTVQYYRDKDQWEVRLDTQLSETTRAEDLMQSNLKLKLRQAVVDGIDQLRKIVSGATNDQHRVLAFRELVSTAIKMAALDGSPGRDLLTKADFKDDLECQLETTSSEATPIAAPLLQESPGSGDTTLLEDSALAE